MLAKEANTGARVKVNIENEETTGPGTEECWKGRANAPEALEASLDPGKEVDLVRKTQMSSNACSSRRKWCLGQDVTVMSS